MNMEVIKVLAPYFTSIMGAVVAIGIAIYNNATKTKAIENKLSALDKDFQGINHNIQRLNHDFQGLSQEFQGLNQDFQELKKNHFFHLGEYLKKLNAYLRRGNLMDDVEKAEMDILADGVAGIR